MGVCAVAINLFGCDTQRGKIVRETICGLIVSVLDTRLSSLSWSLARVIAFVCLLTWAFLFIDYLLLVQYSVSLYRYLKEWRKNPHCSFSCCLALLLPLNDLEGEIFGLTETDALKSQLQTGDMEMPTILSAVKDSGAVDVTLEERYDGTIVKRAATCKASQHNKAKCHKETQTATPLITACAMIHEKEKDTHF